MSIPSESEQSKILEGSWDDNTRWEFHLSERMPPRELCTAVACIAIYGSMESVVLVRNTRGWEPLGGHIEDGETVEDALLREIMEEGGYAPDDYSPFGYRKVISKKPVPRDQGLGYYPYPVSYVPHYLAVSNRPLRAPTGPPREVLESRAFILGEISELHISTEGVIRAGLEVYKTLKEGT